MSEAHTTPLGILGGTFDPVHCAHMQLAEDACKQLGLAQVLWIPAGNPPHRTAPGATAEQRLAMVALAIEASRDHDRFLLDDSEVRSVAPSYTIDTLQRLRAAHGTRPLVLLLGADAFLGLPSWHRWHELFEFAHVAVATRPGYALNSGLMGSELRREYSHRLRTDRAALTREPAGFIFNYPIKPLDISASTIRNKLAAGEKIQDLLPPVVLDYIANNNLYSAH